MGKYKKYRGRHSIITLEEKEQLIITKNRVSIKLKSDEVQVLKEFLLTNEERRILKAITDC